jgi:hypothetical protein
MRSAVALLVGLCAAGLVAVLALGAGSEHRQAFTLGVGSAAPVVQLKQGDQACQAPIVIPDGAADFDSVVVALGTFHRPGPELALTIEPAGGGSSIARGRLAPGYPDIVQTPTHAIPVGHVDTRRPFQVCLRNAGSERVAIYGSADAASRTSTATFNGKPVSLDLNVSFDRAEPRSALSLLPTMFDRAALWRASWVGGWLYILLALLVAAGVPALVAVALRDATRGR